MEQHQGQKEGARRAETMTAAVEHRGQVEHRRRLAQRCLGEDVALRDDPSRGIDKTADPGIGGPDQGALVFHRPQYRHGHGLVGRAGAPIPGVIGDVDQQIGAANDALVGDGREN
jgi:hypothetical protein